MPVNRCSFSPFDDVAYLRGGLEKGEHFIKMPKYRKGGKGKFVRKKKFKFEHHAQMRHWLSRTAHDSEVWTKHFQNPAREYSGEGLQRKALRKVATKTPHSLAQDVFAEVRRYNRGKTTGGGISETINFFAGVASDALGRQQFEELIGTAPEHREMPNEDKLFAKALDATYKPVKERPDSVGNLTRMPEYDHDRFSVWKEPNNQVRRDCIMILKNET